MLCYANVASTRDRVKKERARETIISRLSLVIYISSVRGLQTTRVARFISWRVIHLAAPSETRCSLSLLLVTFFLFSSVVAFLLLLRNYKLLRDCWRQNVSSERSQDYPIIINLNNVMRNYTVYLFWMRITLYV